MAREVDQVLGQFVRGQLTVMAILAVLYAVAYSLLGVRLAVPIGVVAGLLSFIPYAGGALALGLALLMVGLHFQSWGQLLAVIAAYGVIQLLEGFLITPRIVGDKLGLPPLWVLFSMMVGGELFGFMGVMLALPASAVIKVFVGHALARYRGSALFGAEPSLALAPNAARLRLRRQPPRRRARAGR
jgi:predicted PurR-regulated permease PerM